MIGLWGGWEERCWRCLAGFLGAAVAGLLAFTPLLQQWELRTQDLRFRLRGPRATHARIVIGAIDELTCRHWPEDSHRWGFQYAAAIGKAQQCGARWIGLDFVPQLSWGSAAADDAFREVLARGNVILSNDRPPGKALENPKDEFLMAHPEQPINTGFNTLRLDLDDVVRHAAIFDAGPQRLVPSLPAVIALRVRGQSPLDERALRALTGPSAASGATGTIWINYVGPPGSVGEAGPFPYLSLAKLAAGDLSHGQQDQLRDAVLLIGDTVSKWEAPFRGPGDLYYNGVEIHAHTLATLLDQRPLRRATGAREAWIAVGCGGLIALAAAWLPIGWSMLAAALVAGLWWGSAIHAFRGDALWPLVGPSLAIGLAWVGQLSAGAVQEVRHRRQVQGVLERYLSPSIAQYLLGHPDHLQLGGVEREVSVLILDIRGYTTAAQGRSPALVLSELNAFFSELLPLVERGGGLVLQYTGDGLLAVFGAFRPLENHAQAAVAAAIGMARVTRRLSTARGWQGGKPLRVGCGVHSGVVMLGNRGGPGRVEFSVVGDTVNVAARLEQLNKAPELNQEFPSEVVISSGTFERLSEPPPVRGPFLTSIRGREGPFGIYQVCIPDE